MKSKLGHYPNLDTQSIRFDISVCRTSPEECAHVEPLTGTIPRPPTPHL
jgi:hypothetical protein